MKSMIIVALALVAIAVAFPVEDKDALTDFETFEQNPEGSYRSEFQTQNGIQRKEVGELKTLPDEDNKPHDVLTVRGSYSYIDPEGKLVTIEYSADENGFQAQGDSVPKVQEQ